MKCTYHKDRHGMANWSMSIPCRCFGWSQSWLIAELRLKFGMKSQAKWEFQHIDRVILSVIYLPVWVRMSTNAIGPILSDLNLPVPWDWINSFKLDIHLRFVWIALFCLQHGKIRWRQVNSEEDLKTVQGWRLVRLLCELSNPRLKGFTLFCAMFHA